MTRVLHISTASRAAGLERVIADMAEAQRGRGDEVHIAALTSRTASSRLLQDIGDRRIATHLLHAAQGDLHGQRAEIEGLVRRIRPDIVHAHGLRVEMLVAKACRRAGAAVVATLHTDGLDPIDRRPDWLRRSLVRECDGVIAISELMATTLLREGVPAERLHVIPDSLPNAGPRLPAQRAREALGIPMDRWVIGWVGALDHSDGLDLLLDALALLPDPQVGLAVLGDGEEQARLHRQAQALGLGARVTWCGAVPDPGRFLPGFDLLAVSARAGGPRPIMLEAMSTFIPVVATVAQGQPGAVTPATALLVPGEDPHELAAGIHHVRSFPGSAARRSLRAHVRWSRRCDAERWVAEYARAYDSALRRRRTVSAVA